MEAKDDVSIKDRPGNVAQAVLGSGHNTGLQMTQVLSAHGGSDLHPVRHEVDHAS